MNKNELFQNIISEKKGGNAVGVQKELKSENIPDEVKNILHARKAKKLN
ncbi:hypothetical protein [Bdellovibrio reynosensis]|uniref:Uncharacterized protein n=1 Tax=Bdellovibrio reynosensis TaxID=2835041 RepID=A0ABY4CA74_9BACT|nr:hypothetical protein [Bdellovibrio reynosensis]UOF01379.1 hypothetical protein MNR06_00225 [Bdellovibrio reynosensis]